MVNPTKKALLVAMTVALTPGLASARPALHAGAINASGTNDATRWSVILSAPINTDYQGLLAAPTGGGWTVDYEGGVLQRFAPNRFRRAISIGGGPVFVIYGADGNLWLNDGAAEIVRATPEGGVTKFVLPTYQYAYGGLTMAAGDVWITEQTAVGRVTPTGHLTQYNAGNASCGSAAKGIVTGSDGRVWYGTDCGGGPSAVFAIDPTTGTQTGYTVPFSPRGVVSGPDGAIWFTSNQDNGLLGRISTTGSVTTYPVLRGSFPAFSSAPQDIAVGGDGDIWYIQDLGVSSLLGHIDPVTKRSWLITPPADFSGRMNSIAAGPGRQLWMSAGNEIYAYRIP